MEKAKQKKIGAVGAAVVIVIVVALAIFYYSPKVNVAGLEFTPPPGCNIVSDPENPNQTKIVCPNVSPITIEDVDTGGKSFEEFVDDLSETRGSPTSATSNIVEFETPEGKEIYVKRGGGGGGGATMISYEETEGDGSDDEDDIIDDILDEIGDDDPCAGLEGDLQRICYMILAGYHLDVCQYEEIELIDECLLNYARQSVWTACEKIIDTEKADNCYYMWATLTENQSICENIVDQGYKTECESRFV